MAETKEDSFSFLKKIIALAGKKTLNCFILVITSSLLIAAIEYSLAIMLQVILSELGFVSEKSSVDLNLSGENLVYLIIGLAAFRSLFLFAIQQGSCTAMESFNNRLRKIAAYSLLFGKNEVSSSSTFDRISEHFPKATHCCNDLAFLSANFVQIVILTCAIFWISWREALIGFFCFGIIGMVVAYSNKRVRKMSSEVPKYNFLLAKGLERISKNLYLIRSLRIENLETTRFVKNINSYTTWIVKSAKLANLISSFTPFMGILMIVATVVISRVVLKSSNPEIITILYLLVRVVQLMSTCAYTMGSIGSKWPQFVMAVNFGSENLSYLKLDRKRNSKKPTLKTESIHHLECSEIAFSYFGNSELALKSPSFKASLGEQIAIIGKSGAGKSTLLGIILGLIQPDKGYTKINGHDAYTFLEDNAFQIAYVGSEAFLFEGTLRDNLAYGNKDKLSENDIWSAIKMAGLYDELHQKPQKLEYRLKENGEGLSAGQKQRLCLARAFARQPRLLILDEASANLDSETEKAIAITLNNIKNTCITIIVTHRIGLAKFSDRVIELNKPEYTKRTAAS